jgi:D-alanine-D-alanine ligase
MKNTTVAVLRGGPSTEYDTSMKTGQSVISALQNSLYNTKDIIVTRQGQWLVDGFHKEPEQALFGVDVVFIALHGAYGEDGTVQRILDRLYIPYVGTKAYASSLAMNKYIAKDHLKKLSIKLPRHMRITAEGISDPLQTAQSITNVFGKQYIVKPTSGGSSFGIKRASNMQELGVVIAELSAIYPDLLVEEYIHGTEATVGIIEDYRDQALYDLPAVEIIPTSDEDFFTTEAKYNGSTNEICPGRFTKTQKQLLTQAAREIHTTLGLRHYSRSDFIVTDDDIYFLEVNTLPGLTTESLFPKALQAVGGTPDDLVHHLVTQALLPAV